MNRYNTRGHLLEVGYTWEEAEEQLDRQAEEQADAQRDQQMLEEYERTENAKRLEDWSKA